MWGGGSRGATAAGGGGVLFGLNYTVTQDGQRRKSANKRGKKEDTYCKEGLAQTVGGEGGDMEKESDLGQMVFARTS